MLGVVFLWLAGASAAGAKDFCVLAPESLAPHVERFNTLDREGRANLIPNAQAREWLQANIPRFDGPDPAVVETYYFRWWSFRKHIASTPRGYVITEFLTPVKHAGPANTISCAASLHLAEGRWLQADRWLDDYTRFWLRGHGGKPQPHFHRFSSWFAAAVWDRYLVNGDAREVVKLLPDLVADYRAWEAARQATNGLFWQFDVADGMEESISGSRTAQNLRPTINSYMFGNAQAISRVATLARKPALAAEFSAKADALRRLTQERLWDADAQFFKVLVSDQATGGYRFSTAREAIGFLPWLFNLPASGAGYERAWTQFTDPEGFAAPAGITTAERRHPDFRSHGVGTCEWDGAVWPFASSQTLGALANVLRNYPSAPVTAADYFAAFLTYTRSQRAHGEPFIGEYLDEVTGDWINRTNRSAYYNHSTYADLLITGVIGLRPRPDNEVELWPLLPADTWDWFCLDGVRYHGRTLTVIWDKDGSRYGRGQGLRVLASGKLIAQSPSLGRLTGRLP
jgi:hypothetical protein